MRFPFSEFLRCLSGVAARSNHHWGILNFLEEYFQVPPCIVLFLLQIIFSPPLVKDDARPIDQHFKCRSPLEDRCGNVPPLIFRGFFSIGSFPPRRSSLHLLPRPTSPIVDDSVPGFKCVRWTYDELFQPLLPLILLVRDALQARRGGGAESFLHLLTFCHLSLPPLRSPWFCVFRHRRGSDHLSSPCS